MSTLEPVHVRYVWRSNSVALLSVPGFRYGRCDPLRGHAQSLRDAANTPAGTRLTLTLTRYGQVMQPTRPTTGWVINRRGDRSPIGFAEDPTTPGAFYPRHPDGSVIFLLPGDVVESDVLHPGQMIKYNSYPSPRPLAPPSPRTWWARLWMYYGLGR